MTGMKISHQVLIFDPAAHSRFWAWEPGGTVDAEDDWYMVFVRS